MDNENKIKETFDKVVSEMDEVTQDAVNEACSSMQAAARETSEFGEGTYIKGLINNDAGGVSFRFKQPAQRIRLEHFVETDKVEKKQLFNRDLTTDPVEEEPTVDRAELAKELASNYEGDDLTSSGFPQVSSLNRDAPEGTDPFTAEERDSIFL